MDTIFNHTNRKSRFINLFILFIQFVVVGLVGCTTQSNNDAPVTNGWQDTAHVGATYRVTPGETLYSIAWRYGLDYRQLIAINHFQPPYRVSTGQIIKIAPDASDETTTTTYVSETTESNSNIMPPVSYTKNSQNSAITGTPNTEPVINQNNPINNVNGNAHLITPPPVAQTTETTILPIAADVNEGPVHGWIWPVRGPVIDHYTGATGFNKGIDIAGHIGEPIHATASGKVVYAGNGLHGYGQLIIIKHNDEFLSAYAHNSKILVHEGQVVRGGQVIALMGNTEAQRVMLHFEIRRAGIPVDPLTYLNHS